MWIRGLIVVVVVGFVSTPTAHAKPDKGAWKGLPNALGAKASYRCYFTRYNKYMKKGRNHVWTCDVQNNDARVFSLSIRVTAKGTVVASARQLRSRSTIKPGKVHSFGLNFTRVAKGGAVTMWHGRWCWRGMRCRRRNYRVHAGHRPLINPVLKGKKLPAKPERILKDILAAAGIKSAWVTSTSRTPYQQARVMYDVIAAKEKKKAGSGFKYSYRLYGKGGDGVTKIYETNKTKNRKAIIKLMETEVKAQIKKLGPDRKQMMHTSRHYVFDVAPSSIKDKAAFIAVVEKHPKIMRFLKPPADKAYHLEIRR